MSWDIVITDLQSPDLTILKPFNFTTFQPSKLTILQLYTLSFTTLQPHNLITLGTDGAIKTDEFSEKFQRGGGGSFPIQKFILQNLDL